MAIAAASKTARKFFSEVCSLPTVTATKIGTMMGVNGWGFEPGTNNSITTTPSYDSTIGTSLSVTPASATVYLGHDQYVRDSAGVGPPRTYKGVPIVAGATFDIAEYCRGLVDIYEVWLYCPAATQNINVIFKGI